MFESNFPPDKQSGGYTELWNAFKRISAGMSAAEKTPLYSGTAARVYRITAPSSAGPITQDGATSEGDSHACIVRNSSRTTQMHPIGLGHAGRERRSDRRRSVLGGSTRRRQPRHL